MKILVTGATGFVGKRLVPALIAKGHEVRCSVSKKVNGLKCEQVIVERLEHEPDWSAALAGVDIVIHLAARVHVMHDKSKTALDDYCKINSIATRELAKQAAAHQVKRFIFLSSIKVNGEFTHETPFTEESKVSPEDPYGQSKLYAEQYLRQISEDTHLEVVIVRPPLVYGPEVKANFLKMMQLVEKRIPLPFARVNNKRHLIFIENLVSALCLVAFHPHAANQTYLVADDDCFSLTQMLRIIGHTMNVNLRLLPVPVSLMKGAFHALGLKNMNQRLFGSLEVSNSKIKKQLGWIPPIHSVEGLKATVAWYDKHNAAS